MAEQNILNGGLKELEQILGDVEEHADKKEKFEELSSNIKELSKEIDNLNKAMNNEIDSKIKESTEAICSGYDKAINAERDKTRDVKQARLQAKKQGVKDRISDETSSLRAENAELLNEINSSFAKEGISKFFNSKFFLGMFFPRLLSDYCIAFIMYTAMFVGIPLFIYGMDFIPSWVFIIYVAIIGVICLVIQYIFRRKVIPNQERILKEQENRIKIARNKKQINKIAKKIKEDKDEGMYQLEEYDETLAIIDASIANIEGEKKAALDEFEKTAKADILSEIHNRYDDKLEKMTKELDKKKEECESLDDLVKQQRIYIASNYEAYLGKEFMNVERLEELHSLMKSGVVDTISQALVAYRSRH